MIPGISIFGWLFFKVRNAEIRSAARIVDQEWSRAQANSNRDRHSCPFCAEPIRIEAKICPFCRSELPPSTFSAALYPEEYNGVRFRQERDGSVVIATPDGPRRFNKWQEFWQHVTRV
jgi:hypothetical protein